MNGGFQAVGANEAASFTLKLYRGEGMALIAMNWKNGTPPPDFAGFGIEYKEPGGDRFYPIKNRISFAARDDKSRPVVLSSMLSPIQKFRWVHFPRNAGLPGKFIYRVTPVFMNKAEELSYGEAQEASIEMKRETYPGKLNVAFTRGFVSSQAFSNLYNSKGAGNSSMSDLLPCKASEGLGFTPTCKDAKWLLSWMGFEAKEEIMGILKKAVEDKTAQVRVVAYDLNLPDVVSSLERLGKRLKIIIDNSRGHGRNSAEDEAERRLAASAGGDNVKRQHMSNFQHNKTIVVDGSKIKAVICGSTNFSWRGLFIQANNAVVLYGKSAVEIFTAAFEEYWKNIPASFRRSGSAKWQTIRLKGVDSKVSFSPHSDSGGALKAVIDDIGNNVSSSLFYSIAFLYNAKKDDLFLNALAAVSRKDGIFSYGISENKVNRIKLTKPDGTSSDVSSAALLEDIPKPFVREFSGKPGIRMHHKFIVVDFDKPTARVYLGSHNFSSVADNKNGDNMLLIRDRKIAVSYAVEALRIFDHYHYRCNQKQKKRTDIVLAKPPRRPKERPWWEEYYKVPIKIKDRELFA